MPVWLGIRFPPKAPLISGRSSVGKSAVLPSQRSSVRGRPSAPNICQGGNEMILEIRSAEGGEDSKLFVKDLTVAYMKVPKTVS